MTPRLSNHFSTFGLVFFVFKSLLEIVRQWSREKSAILTLKPRSRVGIILYYISKFIHLTKARPGGTLIAAAIMKATEKLRREGRARGGGGKKKKKTPAHRAMEIGERPLISCD